jgi:hypothetical protein
MSMFNFDLSNMKHILEPSVNNKEALSNLPYNKKRDKMKLDLCINEDDNLKTIECDSIRTNTSDEVLTNMVQEGRYIPDEDFENFVNNPLISQTTHECNIVRKRSGKTIYYNVIVNNNIILSAEKKSNNNMYTIFKNNTYDDKNVIALLTSNFLGTEFVLINDNKGLIAVTYDMNVLGIKGPRKMKIYNPYNKEIKVNKGDNMIKNFKTSEIQIYKNKMPIWSESKVF